MPTSFTSPTNGQTADASHVTQFVAPINNLESGAALYAESAGSSTAYTATLAPVPALSAGLTIRLKMDETNAGASTLNVNGLGAVDIRYDNGSAYNTALPASFLKAGGVYQFTYNGTFWLVTGGAAAGSGGGSVATLDDVGDVAVTGAANGTVLMKVTGGWEHRNLIIADINSLQTALDGKSATSHTHSLDNLSDVAITTPAAGNVLRFDGSNFVNQNLATTDIQSGNFTTARLATGTASNGLLPVSNGSGAAVWGGAIAASQLGSGTANSSTYLRGDGQWATPSGGGGGAPLYTIATKTTTYTITTSDNYIRCNHASTPFTVTLPAATGSGIAIKVKNIGAAVVTVEGNASETIDGALNIALAQYSAVTLVDAASGAWDIV